MPRFAGLFFLAFAAVLTCHADSIRMIATFQGNPAGENVYEYQPDGSFTSKTTLILGSTTINSTMTGKFVGKRLAQFRMEISSPSAKGPVTAILTLQDGKLHANSAGKETDIPLKLGDEAYYSTLHPQLTASALQAIDANNPKPQMIKVFTPEAGAIQTFKFATEPDKIIPKGRVRMFNIQQPLLALDAGLDDSSHVVAFDVPGQKLLFLAEGWEALYKDPLAAFPELSQPTFKVRTDKGLTMKTRDGVTLYQDLVRPDAPGKFPVILERTPYGRDAVAIEGPFYASRGYVFVAQDCRGRSSSGGEWDPMVHERKDGYDAVQWIAEQPWCDGNVGMIGASYDGFVQWAAATELPPALKCIVPQVSPPDPFLNLPYDHGIFFLWGALWWSRIVAGKEADMSNILAAMAHPDKLRTLPLEKIDKAVLGQKISFFDKWLTRDSSKDWTGYNYEDDLRKVTIPALNISGWWDGDEIGTMTNWATMRSLGRRNQWLIYGPWSHIFNSTTKLADADFGPSSMIDLDSVYLRWFDTWLKHKDVGQEKQAHVRAFVTGANQWVESNDWPLSGSRAKTLYLSADAPTSPGALGDRPAKWNPPSTYTYDPHKAPIDSKLLKPDPLAASFIVKLPKTDVGIAYFKTAPLKTAMTVSGPITLDLRFSTSAQDTDFYVSMLDTDEKGVVRSIGQPGKIRCSYLGGYDKMRALHPGRVYDAKIRLWDFAHEFKAGHRLGVVIRSSMFPLFARNLGTVDPILTATRIVIQHERIYHDAKNPSSLTFQVMN